MDDTIYELPDPPRLELGDGVIWYFGSKICQKKQEEDTVLEQIKKEYNFDEIKDPFDKATVPLQLDFVMGEIIKISLKLLNFCCQVQKIENLFYCISDIWLGTKYDH